MRGGEDESGWRRACGGRCSRTPGGPEAGGWAARVANPGGAAGALPTSESGAPALFGPLPRRAAAFLRFVFLVAPLSPLLGPSVPARVHGEATLRGPWAGRLGLHRLVAPNACPEPPSWLGEAFVAKNCEHLEAAWSEPPLTLC